MVSVVKKKMVAVMLIISILPLLVLSAYSYQMIDKTIASNFDELSQSQTAAITSDVNSLIENNMITVRQLAVQPLVQSMNAEATVPLL